MHHSLRSYDILRSSPIVFHCLGYSSQVSDNQNTPGITLTTRYEEQVCYFSILIVKYFFLLLVLIDKSNIRHFSHVIKSRIFKNLNLRKKADPNFCGIFLKSHFKYLKLYSNPPSWLARSRCHVDTFWKTKDWNSHFRSSQPFRFWYVEMHC